LKVATLLATGKLKRSAASTWASGRSIGRIAGLNLHVRQDELSSESSSAARLIIRLFGGMAIQDSRGVDYLPRSRKTRAMVAMLTLSAPRPVQRVQLTALLWSRRENEQARASLRQSVHELQETLRSAWGRIVIAERHSLSLDLRGVTVDVIAAGLPGAPRNELLTLFQGGFLEDLGGLDPAFDMWLAKERFRLRGMARAAGEAFLRERHVDMETIAASRALLRIDRTHDGAWRALIQAHLDGNDRAAARFACEQWRDAIGLVGDQEAPPDMAEFLARIRSGHEGRPQPLYQVSEDTRVPEPEPRVSPVDPRRPGLRLGIREMRVIGPDVDRALSAGLAEEVTTALSRFRWISCVSGSSLGAISGEAGDANVRWSDIGLDLILDGTIQRGGDRLRITVRLLDLRAGGAVVWANRFDHAAGDALTVQDGVAAAIVAQVDPVLLIREGELAAARVPRGASARELVLQAVPAIYRLDRVSFRAAGDLLESALLVEPANVDALAWFAYWHLFLVGQGWAEDPEAAISRAALLADSAVAMDPNDARALTLAGHVRGFLMKRPSEATVLHERAISLNPNLALAWCFSGFALSYLGDQKGALARMGKAIVLSPSDPHLFFFQAAVIMPHLLRGDYEDAAMAGRKAIELNPWFSSSFKGQLAALGHLGRGEEAASVMVRLLKLEPKFTVRDAIRRSPMNLPADVERYAEGLRRAGLPER
jgi:DNA-binding SARP family transcriptional activator/TolB-like protein